MDPKTGLYSKAAKIIRGLQQERGTAEQFIGAARKLGLKDAELQHAGRLPEGQISREDLARIFEARLPRLLIDQYGENPRYLSNFAEPPNVQMEHEEDGGGPQETQYSRYRSSGGDNYRERLLKLDDYSNPLNEVQAERDKVRGWRDNYQRHLERDTNAHGPEHPLTQQTATRLQQLENELQEREGDLQKAKFLQGDPRPQVNYHSGHWTDHPNVLAHIRLSDRTVGEDKAVSARLRLKLADHYGLGITELASGIVDRGVKDGVITPEEAATLSRVEHWYTPYSDKKGLGKRLLHVEELQSDWGQEGRDQGFNTGAAKKAYQDHVDDMRARMHKTLLEQGLTEQAARPLYTNAEPWHLAKFFGEEDKLNKLRDAWNDEWGKVPTGPYVTNTQHWTDLALKNVLREAALGNYDGIVFASGQNQADRYGLEEQLDRLQYSPQTQTLAGTKNGNWVVNKQNVKPEDLHGLLGKDLTERLMHPDNIQNAGATNQFHELQGDDLKMGGQGMKGYYDNIVPKAVMRLARQHDPDIQPGAPISYKEDGQDYQGFHLPMTDQLRQSILNEGFPAMRRGGRVGYSTGGNVGGMMMRMRRAGINTRDDFWNRWRDYMRAKAGPDTRLSMTLSPDSHFKRIDDMLGFHRQTADEKGLSQVLKSYGPPNEQGHMAARFPREILQSAGIEPTVENAHAVYEALPSDESGRVGFSNGGLSGDNDSGTSHILNGEEHVKANAPAARVGTASRPQAGEFSVGRGVRGGSSLLQASAEGPLEGLPAAVRIPRTGQVIQAGPDPRIRAVAKAYMAQAGLPYNPPTKYAKVDPARARRIAKAYDAMTDDADDPLTRASYAAMIKETLAQYEAAKAAGFKAEFWNPRTQRDPYEASPRLAVEDVRNNHHMWVYPTYDGYGSAPITEEDARKNPMLQLTGETWNGIPVTVNDIFRAVHDYFGHAKEGVGFRHDGEENAWRSHASMYSPLARLAMTSETRGQNSWLNFGPHGAANQNARTEDTVFAPQKVGILPHWVHHEGAEDFMLPEDIEGMVRARAKYNVGMNKALEITRGFTKNGKGATLRLGVKE